jgi:hypothetical protein
MSDPKITKWNHRGKTYLWRYKDNARNYPGWHFTADDESCDAFHELFEIMNAARYSGVCTISITAPTPEVLSVPNNRDGKARYESAKQLMVKYDPSQPHLWDITFKTSSVTLSIGKNHVQALRQGIKDIKTGNGDYAIGPMDKGNCLWIWWI